MIFLVLFLPATIIWGLGSFSFYRESGENFYLVASVSFFLFYLFLVLSSLRFFKVQAVSARLDLISPFKLLLFVKIIVFFLVVVATIQIFLTIHYSGQFGYDYARFYVRSLPFFGFLSRIEYWWAIALSPILAYLIYFGLSKLNIFILVMSLMYVELASGSKAGVVWFFLSFLLSFIYFKNINYAYYKRFKKMLIFMAFFSFFLLFSAFWIYSGAEILPAINGLIYRLSFGAIEGLLYVKDYFEIHGYSFPAFSLVRPIELSFSTFRLIEKDYLNSVDTGVFLARYFERENDLASWTISWVGLGYLDLGWFGVFLIGFFLIFFIFNLLNNVYRSNKLLIKFFSISLLVVVAHFLDWGWSDGIFVFALIYVILFYLLLFIFLAFIPWKKSR